MSQIDLLLIMNLVGLIFIFFIYVYIIKVWLFCV